MHERGGKLGSVLGLRLVRDIFTTEESLLKGFVVSSGCVSPDLVQVVQHEGLQLESIEVFFL